MERKRNTPLFYRSSQAATRFWRTLFGLGLVFTFLSSEPGHGQGQVESRFIGLGQIWAKHENLNGGGWESNFGWPQGYFRYKNPAELRYLGGNFRRVGPTVGVRNWTLLGKTYAYRIFSPGSSSLTMNVGDATGMPTYIKKVVRRLPPTIIWNGQTLTYPPVSWNLYDLTRETLKPYDEVAPDLVTEEMIESQFNYGVGITCTTRLYAYGNKDYENIFFYWYNFKNTGNIDADPTIELPGQTLQGVCVTWSEWPHVSWEGGIQNGAIWQEIGVNDDWGDYYGENYLDYLGTGTPAHPNGNPAADSLRVWIRWDGDQRDDRGPGDDTGDPNRDSGFSESDPELGRFLSPQYVGSGILHADKSVSDKANDLTQPFTTTWVAWEDRPKSPDAHEPWYKIIFSGIHNPSPQEAGMTAPWERGVIYGFVSIGPYEMPFGSEFNVVLVGGVGGLSRQKCSEYGAAYVAGQLTDAQKNALIATGRDSLLAAIGRATRRYFLNLEQGRNPYDVPDPPPAPDLTVTAKQNSILVSWSDVSQVPDFDTGVKDFAGYRLYRASNDSTGHRLDFKLIWQGTALSYEDSDVQAGESYFYMVTAFDDGTQNWERPGEPLESSKFANRTTEKPVQTLITSVKEGKGNVPAEFFLTQSYPNPFTPLDNLIRGHSARRMVLSNGVNPVTEIQFGIPQPAAVKLEVFNVTGQLVRTLVNEPREAGYYRAVWDGTNQDGVPVPSGVYLYRLTAVKGVAAKRDYSSMVVVSKKMLLVR